MSQNQNKNKNEKEVFYKTINKSMFNLTMRSNSLISKLI